ncbi:olfactory receptor 10C1-like [Hyla sarda]|uniref:olfactory receptor 10C1-like n=1 Tax=Hyla sarda TaxID=327740 RepID=UPI0024C22639|nr:olfactory receptor 10C1-like [Hyla sarda]
MDIQQSKAEALLKNNITNVNLLGFSNIENLHILIFSLLFLIYCGTVSGNLLVMALYLVSKTLQSPMYFYITQISLCDLLVTTDIVPVLLHTVLYGGSSMTLIGCITQFSIFVMSEASECLLLSVMSYDRYLAICNPLHYHSIMTRKFCLISVNIIWLVAFTVMMMYGIFMCNLYFCGPHIIDHFYCELEPIMQLSCSDTSTINKLVVVIGILNVSCPFIIIVVSYVSIVITILKIPSNTGRHKAFSTCSTHLIVVSILYGTLIIVYMFTTKEQSPTLSKVLSLIYTMLIPLLNPIIYTLRNQVFKEALNKLKLVSFGRERSRKGLLSTGRWQDLEIRLWTLREFQPTLSNTGEQDIEWATSIQCALIEDRAKTGDANPIALPQNGNHYHSL